MVKKYTKNERSFKDIEVERASRYIGLVAREVLHQHSSFPEIGT